MPPLSWGLGTALRSSGPHYHASTVGEPKHLCYRTTPPSEATAGVQWPEHRNVAGWVTPSSPHHISQTPIS